MMREKTYVVSTLLSVLVILSAVGMFNYWQDPAEIFSKEDHYQAFTEALADGDNIVVSGNYDERLFRKSMISTQRNNPEVVVLGSSRVMGIGVEAFDNKCRIMNLAVSGAGLQDDIALWYLYQKSEVGSKSKTIIIGLDPWVLNANSGDDRWKRLADSYEDALQDWGYLEKTSIDFNKVNQLFSISYTRESYKKWRSARKSLNVCVDIDDIAAGDSLLLPDGSRIWSQKDNALDAKTEAHKYVSGKIYQIENYNELDENLKKQFELWIENIIKQGYRVVFFFPPYHPYVYDCLQENQKYAEVFAAQEFFTDFAKEHGIVVLGNYNPSEMGLEDKDFIDGMHLRRNSLTQWLMNNNAVMK